MAKSTIDVVVKDIIYESPAVKSFKLTAQDGEALPGFSAGSHITTYLKSEKGMIERHYSLTTASEIRDYYQIAIRRSEQSKGGSIFWHDHVQIGDRLQISFPKNHFPLSFKANHHVFFAAGIGITPFLAMAADLKKRDKSFELHYAAPSKDQCAFYHLLTSAYPEEIHFYFSKEKQRMTIDLMKKQPIGTHVYFCGPEAMMKEYAEAAVDVGFPQNSIHFELFTPPDFGPQKAFQVRLDNSQQKIEVPEYESLLDTLLRHNIQTPYSCKIGGCGSCQIDVLDGEIEHRDFFLSDAEKKAGTCMLPCVSRAKIGKLVLDL